MRNRSSQLRMSAAEYRNRLTVKPSKYRNVRTEYNGVKYDSKKEAEFAAQLDFHQQNGACLSWTRQVPFRLPGGVIHRVDFMVFELNGTVTLFEVKGLDLGAGKMKRKQVEELYQVRIEVV